MSSGIITGIATIVILGAVVIWVLIASRQHEASKKNK
jgi:hypothetical protein